MSPETHPTAPGSRAALLAGGLALFAAVALLVYTGTQRTQAPNAVLAIPQHQMLAADDALTSPGQPAALRAYNATAIQAMNASAPAAKGEPEATTGIHREVDLIVVAMMKEIAEAQNQFRAAAILDEDHDGVGEFGYISELTGLRRCGSLGSSDLAATQDPRDRSKSYLGSWYAPYAGVTEFYGYYFRMFLPGAGGIPVQEPSNGKPPSPTPAPNLAEQHWCCYAWPAADTGPAFFVDQDGVVLAIPNRDRRYVERSGGPRPNAAFRIGSSGRLGSPKSGGMRQRGHDGLIWAPPSQPETETALRVVYASGKPAPKTKVSTGVSMHLVLHSHLLNFGKEDLQHTALDRLGVALPQQVRAICGMDGAVTVHGPAYKEATLFLRPGGDGDLCIPTKLWLEQGVLHAEVPTLDSEASCDASESAAIAKLREIISAQAQFQARCVIDINRNGTGEYGYIEELGGVISLRGADRHRLSPPLLSSVFADTSRHVTHGTSGDVHSAGPGTVSYSGYVFRMFLPNARGQGEPEGSGRGCNQIPPDASRSERFWCCYAWPAHSGDGRRAFFVNQTGVLLATANDQRRIRNYRWTTAPSCRAAYLSGPDQLGMVAAIAFNAIGADGLFWAPVH